MGIVIEQVRSSEGIILMVVVAAEILMVVVALTAEFLEVGAGAFSSYLEVGAVVFVDEDILVVEMVIFYNYLACLGLLDHEMALEVSHHHNWQPH